MASLKYTECKVYFSNISSESHIIYPDESFTKFLGGGINDLSVYIFTLLDLILQLCSLSFSIEFSYLSTLSQVKIGEIFHLYLF